MGNNPATTNAVERKNKDSEGSLRIDLKEALVRVYRIDKTFCLQYIAAEEGVQIRCRDSSHESADKRKQRCNKQYPKDTEALYGLPGRESNFSKDKATKKTQTTHKASSQKRNWNQSVKSHELISSLQDVKCFTMMVQYVGLSTVSAGETTLDDPEVKF